MSLLTPEEAIFQLLSKDATVTKFVAKNIFPDVAPSGTETAWVVYSRASNMRVSSHDGYDDLSASRYQVTGWAFDSATRTKLRDAIINAMDEIDEEITAGPDSASVHIQHMTDENEFEEGPPKKYGARIDFKIWI